MNKPIFNKRQVLVFRHFENKGYSLFACLGKVVVCSVLSVATLTHASAESVSVKPVTADSITGRTDKELMLDEVSITGSRAPMTALQAAKMVTVITREDVNRAAAASVNDLLKLATGVDVRQRGGFGVQTDISINGGTFDQMAIFLNGINLSNPQTGHNAADFPVSLSDIERIEIYEGASARVFGSAAFNGAVNIVTKRHSDNEIRMGIQGGSFGTFGGDGSIAINSKRVYNRMSGGYLQSDGGTTNDYFKKRQVFYQGSSTSRSLDLFWQAGLSSKDFGASTFYSATYPNQYEETRRIITSVKGDIKLLNDRLILSPTLHWTRNVDHYQLIRGREGAENGENYHRSDVYGGSFDAHLTWALGKTAAGMDIRKEHLISSAYGELLQEKDWTSIGGSTRMYNRRGDRTNTSFFLEHNVILRKWTVSAGLLLNKNTGLDSRFRVYPGIDIAYRPNTHWKLYASWNKALRLPTYTDLYISNRVQQGDLALRPERNSMFKAGIRYRTQGFETTLSGFYSRGRDMIDWVYETATSTRYHALNIGKLDNMGLSIDIRHQLSVINYQLGYAYIHQTHATEQPIYKSLYALEYLRHQFTAKVGHPIYKQLSAHWDVRWQQRVNGYHPYWKIDMKLQWNAKNYELYAKIDNLTAHRYYDIGGVLQPGLWFMAGGQIRFAL